MNKIVICPSCGRQYPIQAKKSFCKWCKTKLPVRMCTRCGEVYETTIGRSICNNCNIETSMISHNKKLEEVRIEYSNLCEDMRRIKQPYKFLTEREWIEACNHFKGCAYCGKPEIEARTFFIPRKRGGSYTKFNIVPSCEKCATAYSRTTKYKGDPFSYLECCRSTAARNRMHNIKEWIKLKLEEYKKEQGNTDVK